MRAIWKGNISFALVSIPISLFSATRRNELSFHHLHKKDMSPVSYKRFCDTEDVEVPWEEITKGYEYEKGQYVEITDEDLDKVDIALDTDDDLLLMLNEALEEFRQKDPTAAELIKLRFFVGLPNQQAAELLGVSERTAKRSWAYARAWLYDRMKNKSASG